AAEAKSEVRHEYLNGEVFAMAGGTPAHGALALAFGGELRNALRDRPCRMFSSDVRVRIPDTGLTTYPDLSIVCGGIELDPKDPNTITNPILIVEVLSETTEGHDRGTPAGSSRSDRSPADRSLAISPAGTRCSPLFWRSAGRCRSSRSRRSCGLDV